MVSPRIRLLLSLLIVFFLGFALPVYAAENTVTVYATELRNDYTLPLYTHPRAIMGGFATYKGRLLVNIPQLDEGTQAAELWLFVQTTTNMPSEICAYNFNSLITLETATWFYPFAVPGGYEDIDPLNVGCVYVTANKPVGYKVVIPLDVDRVGTSLMVKSVLETSGDAYIYYNWGSPKPPTLYQSDVPRPTPTPLGTGGIIPQSLQGNLHLFALMGQSNMVGIDTVPSSQPTSPTVFVFGNNYRWKIGAEPVDAMSGAVDAVAYDTVEGYGPGMAFALRLQELRGTDYAIGLIPCAKGSTTISMWQRSISDATLYGSCLKRIRAASMMGTLDGVLFYQGENDANMMASRRSLDWSLDFTNVIYAMRTDLNNPALPVVFVQISQLPASPYTHQADIHAEQASVSIDYVVMVSALGLPKMADNIHLTRSSQVILGGMMADAIQEILG